jgi:hypothetical protein
MTIPAGRSFVIALEEPYGLGSNWTVRTYRKRILRNKLISSDWFLDGEQAKQFAAQLARELTNDGQSEALAARNPGWTLHRPKH